MVFDPRSGSIRNSQEVGADVEVSVVHLSVFNWNLDHSQTLVVIDPRELVRECLVPGLRQQVQVHVVGLASVQEWKSIEHHHLPLTAVLFNVGGRRFTDPVLIDEVIALVSEYRSVPVVVLSDSEDVTDLIMALDSGVRGFIPTSVDTDICISAIRLAVAGGVFVPASMLSAIRQASDRNVRNPEPHTEIFTPRQAAVANALGQGKPNKIIAYELNMAESTVKVHVRHIMKRLEATNRTEVAYKLHELLGTNERRGSFRDVIGVPDRYRRGHSPPQRTWGGLLLRVCANTA